MPYLPSHIWNNYFRLAVIGALLFASIACRPNSEILISNAGPAAEVGSPTVSRPAAEDANGVFVDPQIGSDSNPGTKAAPMAGLQAASNRALSLGKVVFLAGGEYASAWLKTDLYCGYNRSDWSYAPTLYPSYITGDQRFGIAIAEGRTVAVDSCNITGGGAGNSRSVGVINRGSLTLSNNRISGGDGDLFSYGIIARAPSGCNLTAVNNLIFSGAPAAGNATGVVNHRCDLTLINNTIIADGGPAHSIGINSWSAAISTLLINNVIDARSGPGEQWALAVDSPSEVELRNNNFVAESGGGNALLLSKEDVTFYRLATTAAINACSWVGCLDASSNISGRPLFIDSTYHLAATSPCIDAGIDPSAYYGGGETGVDFEGAARPEGTSWDIGYDERTPISWSVDSATIPEFDFGAGAPYRLWNDPTVMLDAGVYRMWMTAGDPTVFPISVSVYQASSPDAANWTRYDTPILEPGATGAWDDIRIETPSVIKTPDDTYHLYYSGCSDTCAGGLYSIGHATSPDGTVWTKDPANPVVVTQPDPNQWGFYTVAEPGAVYNPGDGRIYLYYVSARGISVNGSGTFGILLATSTDGSNFSHYLDEAGNRKAVITLGPSHPDDQYRGYSTPAAAIDSNGVFHLLYDIVSDPAGFDQIGLAYSQSIDGYNFGQVTPEIIRIDEISWRKVSILAPAPLLGGDLLRVWFSAHGELLSWETFESGFGYAEGTPVTP